MRKVLLTVLPILILAVLWIAYTHTNPTRLAPAQKPTPTLATKPAAISPTLSLSPSTVSCLQVVSPEKNQIALSPLTVTVVVNNTSKHCHWTVFEAQAGTIAVVDNEGTTIGTGVLKTTENWMTDTSVRYNGTVIFTKTPTSNNLILQITEENPSGTASPQLVTLPLKTAVHE